MLIIITVGTSLLENTGGKKRGDNQNNKNLNDWLKFRRDRFKDKDRYDFPGDAKELACKLGKSLLGHDDAQQVGSLDYELSHRCPETREDDKTDALPQELSYLAIVAGGMNGEGLSDYLNVDESVDVAFLASDSEEGALTAQALYFLLTECEPRPRGLWQRFNVIQPENGENVFQIPCLQTDDKERFEREGVPNLIATVHELSSREAYQKIFINFTGGFKGAIPYTTLAANFLPVDKDIRLHYLFQDTPHILELPLYPIGLDFARWHSEAVMLDAARNSRNETYKHQLSPPMKNVAAQKEPPKHSLPALLEQQYQEHLDRDPFQIYSKRVLEQFLGKDSSYYNNLEPLVDRVGSLIWFGDKLPMAADHAAHHHHHLLEIAQSLLTPIADINIAASGQAERPFLNVEEKYVLFASLLLHDCGHTLDVVKDENDRRIPLLPSEVRDYHHVLTWLRLGEDKKENGLDWSPLPDLIKAVRLVCFYHRRRTGWTEADDKKNFPYRDDCRFPAPTENKEVRDTMNLDLLKLIALMRFIDGCDNQSRRVGNAVKTELLEKILNEDAETRMVLLKRTAKATNGLYSAPQGNGSTEKDFLRQKNWLGKLIGWLEGTTKEAGDLFKEGIELSETLNAISDPAPHHIFLLETIRLLDEWKLRYGQKPHLLKHEAVRRVRVLPAKTFQIEGPWDFEVCLEPARLADNNHQYLVDDKEICKFARRENHDTARSWIKSEVESELKGKQGGEEKPVVLEYLQQSHVSGGKWGHVTVLWEDEREAPVETPGTEASDA